MLATFLGELCVDLKLPFFVCLFIQQIGYLLDTSLLQIPFSRGFPSKIENVPSIFRILMFAKSLILISVETKINLTRQFNARGALMLFPRASLVFVYPLTSLLQDVTHLF